MDYGKRAIKLRCFICSITHRLLSLDEPLAKVPRNLHRRLVLQDPQHPQDPQNGDVGPLLPDVGGWLPVHLEEDIAEDLEEGLAAQRVEDDQVEALVERSAIQLVHDELQLLTHGGGGGRGASYWSRAVDRAGISGG